MTFTPPKNTLRNYQETISEDEDITSYKYKMNKNSKKMLNKQIKERKPQNMISSIIDTSSNYNLGGFPDAVNINISSETDNCLKNLTKMKSDLSDYNNFEQTQHVSHSKKHRGKGTASVGMHPGNGYDTNVTHETKQTQKTFVAHTSTKIRELIEKSNKQTFLFGAKKRESVASHQHPEIYNNDADVSDYQYQDINIRGDNFLILSTDNDQPDY